MKARRLLSDGALRAGRVERAAGRAQARFHKDAVDVVHLAEQTALQFRPLKSPKE